MSLKSSKHKETTNVYNKDCEELLRKLKQSAVDADGAVLKCFRNHAITSIASDTLHQLNQFVNEGMLKVLNANNHYNLNSEFI